VLALDDQAAALSPELEAQLLAALTGLAATFPVPQPAGTQA
jgi:hypothetical protein